jgi:hypothetical protein
METIAITFDTAEKALAFFGALTHLDIAGEIEERTVTVFVEGYCTPAYALDQLAKASNSGSPNPNRFVPGARKC